MVSDEWFLSEGQTTSGLETQNKMKNKNTFCLILLNIYFRNPVTALIGRLSGPDAACGPPVDNHCA